MSGKLIIETKDLVKNYGKFVAVDKLNLSVTEGEVFGFLGPNGAGKTTTLLMLLGLTEPTSGTATICGYDSTKEPVKVKQLAGYLPEMVGFYNDLTAAENLDYTAALNGLTRKIASKKINLKTKPSKHSRSHRSDLKPFQQHAITVKQWALKSLTKIR